MTTEELAAINPILQGFWTRPMAEIDADLARLRAEEPVAFRPEPELPDGFPIPRGAGYWAVTRYDDIVEMSRDTETFSSAAGITTLDLPPEFNEFFNSMIAMDDPRHARMRRIVSAGFTPRMLRKLDATIDDVAARIVAEVAPRGSIDFVAEVAAALPLRIICELMDIPAERYDEVFDATNVILGAGDPDYVADLDDALGAILQAGADLAAIMDEVATSKQGGDGDDLTSILVNAEVDGERLTRAELNSFFVLLVVAGNETTRNAISWGLELLSRNPDQRRIWQDDFDAVAPDAVDEIIRVASPVIYMRRTATRDVELHGRTIRAGDKLAMFYLSANRDEAHFTDPYRFDVRRDPNHHIGFGGPGAHFCLGAHLARREITVMFRELFRTLPDITTAGEPALLQSSFIHGIKRLPATFSPR